MTEGALGIHAHTVQASAGGVVGEHASGLFALGADGAIARAQCPAGLSTQPVGAHALGGDAAVVEIQRGGLAFVLAADHGSAGVIAQCLHRHVAVAQADSARLG